MRATDRPAIEPFGTLRALATPAAFLVSIPIGLLSPLVAQLTWLLAFLASASSDAPDRSERS